MSADLPEQRARREIDLKLTASGWCVQDLSEMDLTAGRGVAVREFPMRSGFGFADYLLYVDRKAIGAIEAKAAGALTGVEAQSAKYAAGLPDRLPAHCRPLPFLFESNGAVTFFTNGLDPKPRSRQIFNFQRPETLADLVGQPCQLRGRLCALPSLQVGGLWRVQFEAIKNLEKSLARAAPRALIQMATGSGKTFTAVNSAYRLLKFGKAKRILFLVDRANLGKQTYDEFAQFTPQDDTRKFTELYTVQLLKTNAINPAARVVITTIQRLYSMLKGEHEFDEIREEGSGFDTAKPWLAEPPDVSYTPSYPPEFFDFVIVDECHRSIYDLWAQVLLYFDAFLIGLTATPAGKTFGFFNQNLVMEYGHEQAVADGVNVSFDVYRIRTRITESGAIIKTGGADTGIFVDKRHKLTRAQRMEALNEDLTYTANELDRDVVSESQIRTVVRQIRDRVLPEAFPDLVDSDGKRVVPKTLIFAKDDSHADDIVRMIREEFAEQNDFCEKITYRTGFTRLLKKVKNDDGTESECMDWVKTSSLTPEEILSNFRTSYHPRIAVTVDMIATGTDVKPIECVVFMRNVKSAGFFEQMKGRGVRVVSSDKLRAVTPSARVNRAKERFIIVDAVGVCEQDRTGSRTLNRKPSATLEQLLDYVAQGGVDAEELTTLAARLSRLGTEFSSEQHAEVKVLSGGKTLPELVAGLLDACDPDKQYDAAAANSSSASPSEAEINVAIERLAQLATEPFAKPALRKRLLEIRQQNEQIIDKHSIDEVIYAGFDNEALQKAKNRIQNFKVWIVEHKHELTALQMLYAGTRPLRLSLRDLRDLKEALMTPPVACSPEQLWKAFEAIEAEKVKGHGGRHLTDLVNLVRHALTPSDALVPYAEDVRMRYEAWLSSKGAVFSAEQREWLERMAEHIATSLEITPDDFQDGWFGQHGSLGRAHILFGDMLAPIISELNEVLAA